MPGAERLALADGSASTFAASVFNSIQSAIRGSRDFDVSDVITGRMQSRDVGGIDSGARAAVPPTLKRVVRRVLVELKREEGSVSRALNSITPAKHPK